MMMQANEAANPKINLFLNVMGCRDDGYHEIETVFLPLNGPADRIRIQANLSGELSVSCEDPRVPDGETNLCWRAAKTFADAVHVDPAWHIVIDKRIPIAAGLGGGSADAGAVLRALNRIMGTRLSDEVLRHLAADLGADVPFFIAPCPALGRGIGQDLQPLACTVEGSVVIVSPGFPITAAWAYANLDRCPVPSAPSLPSLTTALADGDLGTVATCTFNALEYAIFDKFPMLESLRESLIAGGCLAAHVSGSGPTLYGLCLPEDAAGVAAIIDDRYGSSVDVFSSQIVTCSGPG